MTEHALLASVPELARKIIHTRTQYTSCGFGVPCASGDDCVAPTWLRLNGKRPPSWTIDGAIYCADCTQAWAVATAKLEAGSGNNDEERENSRGNNVS